MDASWGAAQIMGGIHDVAPMYYGGNTATGGPSAATGYFGGVGVKINTPMIGPGDYFSAQFNYTVGAAGYAVDGASSGTISVPAVGGTYGQYNGGFGGNVGWGIISDGVYANTGGAVELTTTWGVNAAYEHFWNKRWQTSVYGTYISTSYDSNANNYLCNGELFSLANFPGQCNNNWRYWNVGSRTQFNVDSQTYIGLDVIYTELDTSNQNVLYTSGSGTQPVTARNIQDQSAWMAEFRFHRNFYP